MAQDYSQAAHTESLLHADPSSPPPVNSLVLYDASPIDHMPDEILRAIFLNHPGYVDAVQPERHAKHRCTDQRKCTTYCWNIVTHICRRWRKIALSCPALWTQLWVPRHLEWMAELLRRSGYVAPLFVAAHLGDDDAPNARVAAFELALGQLHRIQRLQLTTTDPLGNSTARLLSGYAPMLRTMTFGGVMWNPLVRVDAAALYLPALLRKDRAPMLETLDLRGCAYALAFNGACTDMLKYLNVVTVNGHVPWPDSSALLAILAASPSLQTLVLKRIASSDEIIRARRIVRSVVHRPLRCLRLRRLEIITNVAEACFLLRRLELPALEHLSLTVQRTCTSAGEIGLALASKVHALRAPDMLSIAGFGADDTDVLELTGYDLNLNDDEDLPCISCIYTIALQECDDQAKALRAICEELPLGRVVWLVVQGTCIPLEAWITLGETMENVNELSITGMYSATHLPEALAHRTESQGRGPSEGASVSTDDSEEDGFLFSELTIIDLCRACINRRETFEAGQVGEWWERFVDALCQRGVALGHMEIEVNMSGCSNVNRGLIAELAHETNCKVDADNACTSVQDTDDWDMYTA